MILETDERFDLISKILGLDDSDVRYPKEIINTFIKIMNCKHIHHNL